MRIAIIAPHFPEYTLRYAAAMSVRCPVLVCVDQEQVASEYAGRDLELRQIERLHLTRFKGAWDALKLLYELLRFRPTVVHFQEAVGPRRRLFNLCIATLFRRSATVALTVHDPVPHSGRDSADARRSAWARERVRRKADVIIVHGEYCARQYRQELRQYQQLIVSQHGVILEPAEFEAPPPFPIRLYFFGRMEAYKGLDTLLEAATQLHAAGLPFRLAVEGQGPELDRLAPRFEALPEVSVRRGFVPPRRVIKSIQRSHCVILPYHNATQSGILAAALAGHRCVVASDVGGLSDLVAHGQNGLRVPPGDANALFLALRDLIESETLWWRLNQGAAQTAGTRLNWEVITGDIFQEIEAAPKFHGRTLRVSEP